MMDQCDRKCEDSGKTIEYSLIDDEEFESKAPEADLTTCCESTPDSNQKHAAILQSLDQPSLIDWNNIVYGEPPRRKVQLTWQTRLVKGRWIFSAGKKSLLQQQYIRSLTYQYYDSNETTETQFSIPEAASLEQIIPPYDHIEVPILYNPTNIADEYATVQILSNYTEPQQVSLIGKATKPRITFISENTIRKRIQSTTKSNDFQEVKIHISKEEVSDRFIRVKGRQLFDSSIPYQRIYTLQN